MSFTVISKPNCPFCDQAKALLAGKGESFTEIKIDVGQEKDANFKYISRDEFFSTFPGHRTVPLILKDGNTVGGFMELKELLS